MLFTLDFLKVLAVAMYLAMPLLLFMALLVVVLGQIAGRIERWSSFDSLYWSFITATTVGYGDIRPTTKLTRTLAVAIAFTGIIFTGVVVSLAVQSTTYAYKKHHTIEDVEALLEKVETSA